jgi:NAD-dependent DNA ligase
MKKLSMLKQRADDAYFYSSTPLLPDAAYDQLADYLQEPPKVGATPSERKVRLPHPMGSLDKVKTSEEIQRWTSRYKGPYLLSPKLDGVSALLCLRGDQKTLYTRGDGQQGQDISWMLPCLSNLAALPPCNVVVRGELILKKSTFQEHFSSSAQGQGGNARNIVSGLVNRLEPSIFHSYVDFKAYEVVDPPSLTPEQQMLHLVRCAIPCVFTVKTDSLPMDYLEEMVLTLRKEYPYEIDGVVCVDNHVHDRITEGNPPFAVAFKMPMADQMAVTTVIDVEWKANKDGYLKPRARVLPVVIGGNRIEYVTVFNAAHVQQHGIGVGAIVELTRSGDVIPQITRVKSPAEPTMPSVSYRWNETKVDVMVANVDKDPEVLLQRNVRFFKTLSIPGMGPGQLKKIMDAGFTTPQAIVQMSVADFLRIPGFQQTSSTKLYEAIQKGRNKASMVDLLVASNVFGRGISKKTLESVVEGVPDFFTANEESFQKIKGIGKKTLDVVMEKRLEAHQFLETLGVSP